jgi:hypothetical protein
VGTPKDEVFESYKMLCYGYLSIGALQGTWRGFEGRIFERKKMYI